MAARALALRHEAHGLSYMGLRDGAALVFTGGGEACMGIQIRAGVALALGPPVGPPWAVPAALASFRDWCSVRGLHAAVCGLPRENVATARASGFDVTPTGHEAVIDPRNVDLRGRHWREVRGALNRARSRRLTFRWLTPDERIHYRLELEAVSRDWIWGKSLPEMGFALGGGESFLDPSVRVGVCASGEAVGGFITWVPGRHGWMLELLRYRPGVMAGLADFLAASSLLDFRREGGIYASLSGTPLAHVVGETLWAKAILALVRRATSKAYSFEGLRRFKQKFNPSWEPLYIAHAGRFGLARAAVAILRACMPKGNFVESAALVLTAMLGERRHHLAGLQRPQRRAPSSTGMDSRY